MARRFPPTPFVLLLAALVLCPAAASADVLAEGYELVVLADPAAPAGASEAGPMDLTLTWRVREIFAGEPGSVSVAIRHRQLSPSQVSALGSGERWIVLANKDPERPGRWLAPMPLRATPQAVDAFRKWSAPPDVRPPRAVGEVVEELREEEPPVAPPPETSVAPEIAGPATELVSERAEPVAEAVAPESVEEAEAAEGPIVIEEEPRVIVASAEEALAEAEPVAEAVEPPAPAAAAAPREFSWVESADAEPPPETLDRLERPAEEPPVRWEPAPVQVARVEEVPAPVNRFEEPVRAPAHRAIDDAPLAYKPALQPPTGPGLPPPPPAQPIGPPPAERDDLRKVERRSDDAD